MTTDETPRDWTVTVYRHNAIVGEWTIENRTESEAAQEASADIARDFPTCDDWTLTATGDDHV